MTKLPRWAREFLAEFVATYVFLLMVLSASASSVLTRSRDPLPTALATGIANFLAIAASSPISGGHLNPTVTVAFMTIGKTDWWRIPHYLVGQYLGAFLAAATVFGVAHEGIEAYDGGYRHVAGVNGTGAIFSTYPAPFVESIWTPLVDQIVAAGSFMFTTMVIVEGRFGLPTWAKPPLLGSLIVGHALAFGLNCGATLNPARDLAPRLFQLLVGYGKSTFSPVDGLYWLMAGFIGPHLGGVAGVWLYRAFLHYDDDQNEEEEGEQIGNYRLEAKSSA